jgi:hypothetical protein
MEAHDDELRRFEKTGATPLPVTDDLGFIENDGARIWYAAYGILAVFAVFGSIKPLVR